MAPLYLDQNMCRANFLNDQSRGNDLKVTLIDLLTHTFIFTKAGIHEGSAEGEP